MTNLSCVENGVFGVRWIRTTATFGESIPQYHPKKRDYLQIVADSATLRKLSLLRIVGGQVQVTVLFLRIELRASLGHAWKVPVSADAGLGIFLQPRQ